MNQTYKPYLLYAMAAAIIGGPSGHTPGRRIDTSEDNSIENIERYHKLIEKRDGVKKYEFANGIIYARSYDNAIKKARKKGWI